MAAICFHGPIRIIRSVIVPLTCQVKNFSIQGHCLDRSFCMAAVRYSGAITAVPTNEQLIEDKRMCAKFQIDISKADRLGRVYTNRTQFVTLNFNICYIPYRVSEAFSNF